MKIILLLAFICIFAFVYSGHLQANNAFGKWLGGSSAQSGSNPALSNWLNKPTSNGGANPGASPLNDPTFANIIKNQAGGTNANNPNTNDNAFRSFLQQNRVPNGTQLPTLQECAQYTIRAGGNIYKPSNDNYRVTCSLPGGRNYTENCFGQANCNYLTCKFLKCSKVSGGGVFRVKI